jgi:hypothetical protein
VVSPLKLAMNVVTRFNSLCILFTRLLELKAALQRLCLSHADLNEKALSADQWAIVAELVLVLGPVKETCDILERSSTPSLSLLLPLVCHLLHILFDTHSGLRVVSCRNVCAAVRSSIHQRMMDAFTDKTVRVAMALDPRVRRKRLPNYNMDNAVSALREGYNDFAATFAELRGAAALLRQADEVVAGDSCPLQWWAARASRYPILAEMARVYLAVPASSAPSERVFSVASLVLTDRRRRLDDSKVARLMFLKRNMALYRELTGKE